MVDRSRVYSHPDDPHKVGPWEIVGRIGAGGMGVVLLGQRSIATATQTAVIKLIAADPGEVATRIQPEQMGRFRREIAALMTLHDPGVAQIIAADLDDQPPWYASEHIDGPTLSEKVHAHGPLDPDLWPSLAVTLLGTLDRTHMAGVTHRDLKPANILLGPSGPVLIDFGIATLLGGASFTRTGYQSPQTPGWNSPEQITGQFTGPASDVFSAALVLAWAAGGWHPFDPAGTANWRELESAILNGGPTLDQVPSDYRPLLAAMLAKEPSDRPTAAEARRATVASTSLAAARKLAQRAEDVGWRGSAEAWREAIALHGHGLANVHADSKGLLGTPELPALNGSAAGVHNVSVDSDRMFELGHEEYAQGHHDRAKAWWIRASNAGEQRAMYCLGLLAERENDWAAARRWYTRSAVAGHTPAMLNLGVIAMEQGDRTVASHWWGVAARAGDAAALYNLGMLAYQKGDLEAARASWTRASELGHGRARAKMGAMARDRREGL